MKLSGGVPHFDQIKTKYMSATLMQEQEANLNYIYLRQQQHSINHTATPVTTAASRLC